MKIKKKKYLRIIEIKFAKKKKREETVRRITDRFTIFQTRQRTISQSFLEFPRNLHPGLSSQSYKQTDSNQSVPLVYDM